MAIQKAFTQICQEILDRYDSVLQTNSLSTQTNTEILAVKAAAQSLKEHIETKHNEIQNSIAINQELFERLDKNLAKNELIDRQVNIRLDILTNRIKEAIDNISSIELEILNRVSNAKDDLARSVLMANTASATLNSYNAKSYEILEKFESNDIVESSNLLKGDIIHTNAKLSANRLSLALREGATMAYRIKYELDLRSFVGNGE